MPQNPNATANIGVVGLAVMGSNLARNLASREGNSVAIFNRSYEKTQTLLDEHPEAGASEQHRCRRAGCSCADDDGSADPGSDDGGVDTGGGSGVGSAVVRVGVGSPGGTGSVDGSPPPLSVAFADGLPPFDADAEGDASPDSDSPGFGDPL